MDQSFGQVPCSYHPDVNTGLRCSRCGKPICPLDSVRTPVGLRCPDCAGVRTMGTIRTSRRSLLKAAGVGLLVAIAVAILWRFFPNWQFYLALLLGFGVAEAIAWATNNKRGADLQILAMGIVTVGLILSRVLLAHRFGISWEMVNNLSPLMSRLLQVRVVPDLLFAAVVYLIAWVRFR
jgi:DNA-directed RNA polymerase subunit RPC12/RpoP